MSHILIVDDNAAMLMIEREVLRRAGHTIVTAGDGNQALEAVEKEKFDLVITDIIMPGKEGIETIMELRQRHPGLKIIAMSGGGRVGPGNYLDLAKRLGASATLAKPFTEAELFAAVNTVLGTP